MAAIGEFWKWFGAQHLSARRHLIAFGLLLAASLISGRLVDGTAVCADELNSGPGTTEGQTKAVKTTSDQAGPKASHDRKAESSAATRSMRQRFQKALDQLPANSRSVEVCSRRADLLFFLGRYGEAVENYETMVKLNPELDASHWRLGIAYFFSDQPKKAFQQFDKYHSFDDVDRENGIWRYLSQYRAAGADRARQQLLRYAKDDREPFPAVYQMFEGSLKPADALNSIPVTLPAQERDKRLFYTQLYIGLHKVVQDQKAEAISWLQQAVSRQWPRDAGFGPHFMWQVARLQLMELQESSDDGKELR